MSDFSLNDYKDNGGYQILRGINKADIKYDFQKTDDTSIIDLAAQKAQGEENKSAITVALEDFSSAVTGFHDSNSSNISSEDVKPGFFAKVAKFFGHKESNMYKTDEGQKLVEDQGGIFQNDIFKQDYAAHNGIQYAKEGDDLYESALNFAKADIGAIEKAFSMAHPDAANNNKKLDSGEISSYMEYDGWLKDALKEMDLNGKKKDLSPEEYASYIIAADRLFGAADGTITTEEAQGLKEYNNKEFHSTAQAIYDEHYKK